MTRTDVHTPKNLVTENYRYVACLDLNEKPPQVAMTNSLGMVYFADDPNLIEAWLEERRKLFALFSNSPEHVHGDSHQCDHCGAHFRYCAILKYLPTGNHLIVGEQCLDNRFGRATDDFQAMRKQAELDREKHRILEARRVFAEANPDIAFLAFGDIPREVIWNSYIVDISEKLRRYGELTERQIVAVRRVIIRAFESHEAREKRQAAEQADRTPVVEGRIQITGTIVSVREPDEYATFPTWKMLVEDDRKFKVWGSIPQSLVFVNEGGREKILTYESLKGARVQFIATVEASKAKPNGDIDPSFGFYSRPTKAVRL